MLGRGGEWRIPAQNSYVTVPITSSTISLTVTLKNQAKGRECGGEPLFTKPTLCEASESFFQDTGHPRQRGRGGEKEEEEEGLARKESEQDNCLEKKKKYYTRRRRLLQVLCARSVWQQQQASKSKTGGWRTNNMAEKHGSFHPCCVHGRRHGVV